MIEGTIATLLLNFLGGQVKKFVPEQYRSAAIHGAIFLGSLVYVYTSNPGMSRGDVVADAIGYLALAVGMYEIVLKRVNLSELKLGAFGKIF